MSGPADTTAEATTTVYYDGSCPLCTSEICTYQRLRGGDAITWVDVSTVPAGGEVAPGLTREAAMARFHVRRADGRLTSGASAFAVLWMALPALRMAGRVANLPGIRHGLEIAYRLFLPVRPWLQALARRRARRPVAP